MKYLIISVKKKIDFRKRRIKDFCNEFRFCIEQTIISSVDKSTVFSIESDNSLIYKSSQRSNYSLFYRKD